VFKTGDSPTTPLKLPTMRWWSRTGRPTTTRVATRIVRRPHSDCPKG
jgi:hypothetical protein